VFTTAADLGIGTWNDRIQVYRFDRSKGEALLTLVSVDNAGTRSSQHCFNASISDDGKKIVFETTAALAPGNTDTNGVSDIYLRDLSVDPPVTRLLSRNSSGLAGNGSSTFPFISGSGQHIAFTSAATDFVAGDTNVRDDVFRVKSDATEMTLVSKSDVPTDPLANEHCRTTSLTLGTVGRVLSDDGRFVVFQSNLNNWSFSGISGSTRQQIFLRDVTSQDTFVASRVAGSGISVSDCRRPCITRDASAISFSVSHSGRVRTPHL
jgi:Tol biopolymer transport system component